MEIINLNSNEKTRKKDEYINFLSPRGNFRLLVCGPAGSGKTTMIANLGFYVPFDRIYIYSKYLDDEGPYNKLIEFVENLQDKIRKKTKDDNYQMIWTGTNYDDIPFLNDECIDSNYKNLVFIDDFMNESNNKDGKIAEWFTNSRHKNCSVIFNTQRYMSCDKAIRTNANYFCFFELMNKGELTLICKEQNLDFDTSTFKQIFKKAVNEKYSFLTIDKKNNNKYMRYRKKWDQLLILSEI